MKSSLGISGMLMFSGLRRAIAHTLLITSLAMMGGCKLLTNQLGGAFDAVPEDLE
jgi:hypothetical protein